MIITNCPRCGAMNATTTCTKCGWSQFTKSTVSTRITGEIEIMLSGKALLDDYKRLLLENRNLKERVAELEAESERFTVHSDIERQGDKSPNDTQTDTVVYGKESEE